MKRFSWSKRRVIRPVWQLVEKPHNFYYWLERRNPSDPVKLESYSYHNPIERWLEETLQPDFQDFVVTDGWITWKYRDGRVHGLKTPGWLSELINFYCSTRDCEWDVGTLLTIMLWFRMAPLHEYINSGRRC